ncbi:methyltransferase domain-containing protein [Actinoplanes sp. NPDC051494]|uniref:methyltransferase domain-containing protein n=1 Tax=Actinoplanes sp. NPDC051494 TaxID=3363907 RepID=UPI003793D641
MERAQLERPPFADLDRMPPDTLAMLVSMLEAMSRHPEIRRVRHAAWEALRPAQGQRLLDAGCGAGEVARELAAAIAPDGQVVALDRSEGTLAVARSRADGGGVRYVAGDVCALDFPDETFDGVWCERVLQHVEDIDLAISELARVTREGGRLCLIDTDWTSLAFDGMAADLTAAVIEHSYGRLTPSRPAIGRTLRRRLVALGLSDVTATPVTCLFPDPASAAVVLPMVNPEIPGESWNAPEGLRDAWFEQIDAADDRGDFLAVLTIWVVTAEV